MKLGIDCLIRYCTWSVNTCVTRSQHQFTASSTHMMFSRLTVTQSSELCDRAPVPVAVNLRRAGCKHPVQEAATGRCSRLHARVEQTLKHNADIQGHHTSRNQPRLPSCTANRRRGSYHSPKNAFHTKQHLLARVEPQTYFPHKLTYKTDMSCDVGGW